MSRTVGLIGYGRIGQFLRERIHGHPSLELAFVFVRDVSNYDVADDVPLTDTTTAFEDAAADLVVEAADFDAVADHGPTVLDRSDLMVLSTTAFADDAVENSLRDAAETGGTHIYVPHGAVLGTDGLQDGRPGLEAVHVHTRKNPANIDFSHVDISADEIDGERELYDGSTRTICERYPRNVNSHATIAIAGLGFDETRSTLVADPSTDEATHTIVAEGESTTLEVTRRTTIEGVTGSYTLDSIWGSVRRILDDRPGLRVV